MKKKNPSKDKAPAFQFYASDFYMDTIAWTDEMVGLHIRLMCQQWINGSIESEGNYPAGLDEKRKMVFDQFRRKYLRQKNGKFKNKKLQKIAENRKEYLRNASKAGTAGASKRWGNNGVPYPNPNGVNMTLQSSSSVFNKEREESAKFFELFKQSAPSNIPNEIIWQEVKKLMEKYPGNVAIKSKALVNTWLSNLPEYTPEVKQMVI